MSLCGTRSLDKYGSSCILRGSGSTSVEMLLKRLGQEIRYHYVYTDAEGRGIFTGMQIRKVSHALRMRTVLASGKLSRDVWRKSKDIPLTTRLHVSIASSDWFKYRFNQMFQRTQPMLATSRAKNIDCSGKLSSK